MKCFFTLSIGDSRYVDMAKVLVHSAKANTDLELFCIFDGDDEVFENWLCTSGVNIIKWRISFLNELIMNYGGEESIEFCRGTYLCMELPRIVDEYGIIDEHILYVDSDVMFTGPIDLTDCKPTYFASSSDWKLDDWSRFSTGVIVMNVLNLRVDYPKFLKHLRKHSFDFSFAKMGPCDQGAWNTFYVNGEHEKLTPEYDWKPWCGINNNTRIVHFSGPKPQDVIRLKGLIKALSDKEQLYSFVV